jgi:tetratricopeptide (TPR) repeat protein
MTYYQSKLLTPNDEDYDRAIKDFTQAIYLRQDYDAAFYGRAKLYMRKAQYDLAIADFDKAILFKSDNDDYYIGRGRAYHLKGEYDCAIADFDQAIELKPDDGSPYYQRGHAYIEVSKIARANAVRDLKKYMELGDNVLISKIKEELQELEGAGPDTTQQELSSETKHYFNIGFNNFKVGNYPLAIANLNEAIKHDPAYDSAYLFRGWAFAHQELYQDAVADFKKIHELPIRTPVVHLLAEWLIRTCERVDGSCPTSRVNQRSNVGSRLKGYFGSLFIKGREKAGR